MIREDRARDYADGLYKAVTDPLVDQLSQVSDRLKARPQVRVALDDPAVDFPDKAARLSEILPANATPEVRNFVSLLIKNNEVGVLDRVVEDFRRRVKGGTPPAEAEITSAIALTDRERSTIEERIRAAYGSNVHFNYVVNPEIMGGLIIRVGDKILDGSVRAKLNRLREQILSAL